MAYGSIKVDTIVFTNNSADQSVSISGIIASTSGNLTVTGTISGSTVQATYGTFTSLTGVTTSGTNANFQTITGATGVFTTSISGATVIAPTGTFTSLTGTTATFTSGIIASGTAALPSLAILSDPNTGIFSPGADQLAVATNGTQRITVDADGRLLVGTASLITDNWSGNNESIQTAKSGLNSLSILAATAFTAAHSSYLALNRARGSLASPTIVANGDTLGAVYFSGYDGSSYLRSASIDCVAEGTIAATRIGSRLVFNTSTDAAPSVVTERMRITSGGLVGIGTSGPSFLVDCIASSLPTLRIYDNLGSGTRVSGRLLLGASTTRGVSIANSTDTYDDINAMVFSTTESTGVLTERVRISPEGRLGIGTTSPAANLHIQASTGASLRIQAGSTSSAQIDFIPGGAVNPYYVYVDSSRNFIVQDNASERARIDSSGRLLVGTSSADGLISNISPVIAGAFKSHSGSVSIAPSTTVTIFTIPASDGEGAYTVTAIYVNGVNLAAFSAYAVILYDGFATNALRAMGFDGSFLSITVSGRNVQLTTGATYTQSIKWSFVKQAVA